MDYVVAQNVIVQGGIEEEVEFSFKGNIRGNDSFFFFTTLEECVGKVQEVQPHC